MLCMLAHSILYIILASIYHMIDPFISFTGSNIHVYIIEFHALSSIGPMYIYMYIRFDFV